MRLASASSARRICSVCDWGVTMSIYTKLGTCAERDRASRHSIASLGAMKWHKNMIVVGRGDTLQLIPRALSAVEKAAVNPAASRSECTVKLIQAQRNRIGRRA